MPFHNSRPIAIPYIHYAVLGIIILTITVMIGVLIVLRNQDRARVKKKD